MDEKECMIKLKNVNKSFGDLHVLKDVNLEVKEGEKLVIIGPSGSGKSTTIRCMNYLEQPTSGSVWINGEEMTPKNRIRLIREYVDLHLVQGFSEDMIMLTKSMRGLGDECCTFVNVGYEQTGESKKRITQIKEELNGKYGKDFLYHEAHFLNAVRKICKRTLKESYEEIEEALLKEFGEIFSEELAEEVRQKSEEDFDIF